MQTLILPADAQGIATACEWLTLGQPVAIPTETVYGLAADARNGEAVARIYAAKGRPSFNPLIVHVPGLAEAERYVHLGDQARLLAEAFWPGPLTMILPLRDDSGIASITTAGLRTLGVRIPSHPAALAILRAFDGPLAAPSANPSGRISATSAAHVADEVTGLGGRIPAVVDAGACSVGVESTIIGWSEAGEPALLRPGGLPAEAIEAVLGCALLRPELNPEAPTSPGQLSSHYAPAVPVRLDAETALPGETYLAFGPGALTLSASRDLTEAAANLFDLLRRADELGRPIAVAPIPEEGLGVAINDRLRRAAAPRP
ncbi:L-threonylcarbamoyladenylate synthase [Paracoccus aminophilus]|uniref:Threonylcarbamoyl-AMP synthase n=1 Tax=Paracoccus aminophilus JCM 7686 TaxID=1367847 RepID=S5XQM8_PARAH|nr:L-threonylcarbamoyladenylate synthase [Paracoccus aminophilus]AGT07372.1 translation factor Sua5 [Paracoccus aminophilus JCM 7686]